MGGPSIRAVLIVGVDLREKPRAAGAWGEEFTWAAADRRAAQSGQVFRVHGLPLPLGILLGESSTGGD